MRWCWQQCVADFMCDDEREHRRHGLMSHLCKLLNVVVKYDDVGAVELRAWQRKTQRERLRTRQPGHSGDDRDMDDKAGPSSTSEPRRRLLGRLFKVPI